MADRTFRITLDERQYQDMVTAIETFHRFISGQVEEIRMVGLFDISKETLSRLKREMFPELTPYESYSWNGGHPDPRIDRLQAATYALYREMRHVREVDDASNDWSVYKSSTLTTDKARIPKVEIVKSE